MSSKRGRGAQRRAAVRAANVAAAASLVAPDRGVGSGEVPLERAHGTGMSRKLRHNDQREGVWTPWVPVEPRWLPEDVDAAWAEAEVGVLRGVARLVEAMRQDGTIAGLMRTRCSMVRLPLQFDGDPFLCAELEGVHPVYTDDGMLVSKGVVGAFEVMCPIPALIDLLFTGIMAGVAVAELVDDPVIGLPVLTPRDLHFLCYDFSTHTWIYQGGQDSYVVDPGNGRWVLFCPESEHRPWKSGAWLPCSLAFVTKLAAVFDRMRWQAQLADPLKYFETTDQLAEDHRIKLEDFMNNLWARAPGIVLPPGAKAGVLEIDGKGYEVYEAAEKWGDQQESKALSGGQSVTSDGKGGLSDGGDLFSEIAENIIVNTAAALGQCITRQVVAPWARSRYGYRLAMNGDCPPSVAWDARSPARRAKDAEVLGAFADSVAKADAMLEKRGAMLDVVAFAAQCGVALPVMRLPGLSPPQLPGGGSPDDAPPPDDNAAQLAAKMTEFGIPRCEHGYSNRCPRCGIERVRDFDVAAPGAEPAWRVAWRPIGGAVQPKALPPVGSVGESG